MGLPAPDMTENGQTAEQATTAPANAAANLKTPETPESAVTKAEPPAGDTQSPPPADTAAGAEMGTPA